MDIGNVLSRAWQIIWKHKVLWIFGILAGCQGGGGGGGSSFNMRGNTDRPANFPQLEQYFQNVDPVVIAVIVGIILLIVLFLVIIAVFLGTIGRIGLIRGTAQVEAGAASLSFGELFSGSMPYFWRVFLLNLLVGLAIGLLILIIAVPLVISIVGIFCLIPLLCILVPAGWLISVVLEQANIAIVIEKRDMMSGLRRGWEIVKANLGNMLAMGLILVLGVGTIGGLIISLPILLAVMPLVVGAFSDSSNLATGSILITLLCVVAYLPILLLLSGILNSYIQSAWTLTFLRLTSRQDPVPPMPVSPSELA